MGFLKSQMPWVEGEETESESAGPGAPAEGEDGGVNWTG